MGIERGFKVEMGGIEDEETVGAKLDRIAEIVTYFNRFISLPV